MPELDAETVQLWNMYCVMGEDVLLSLDVYDRKIGLPTEWDFQECLNLINSLQSAYRKLVKSDE